MSAEQLTSRGGFAEAGRRGCQWIGKTLGLQNHPQVRFCDCHLFKPYSGTYRLTPRGRSAISRYTPEKHPDTTTPNKSRASAAMCCIPLRRRRRGFGIYEWGAFFSSYWWKEAGRQMRNHNQREASVSSKRGRFPFVSQYPTREWQTGVITHLSQNNEPDLWDVIHEDQIDSLSHTATTMSRFRFMPR